MVSGFLFTDEVIVAPLASTFTLAQALVLVKALAFTFGFFAHVGVASPTVRAISGRADGDNKLFKGLVKGKGRKMVQR